MLCLFQYISCCSLSYFVIYFNHLFYCFNTSHVVVYQGENSRYYFGRMCFNTSHVVVYHRFAKLVHRRETFQYISCCSLSAELAEYYIKRFGFQYISCCSLSIIADVSAIRWKGFNTSHVVVYQNCNHWSGQMLCCFNTSHVVVYRSLPKVLRIYIIVSIHLML